MSINETVVFLSVSEPFACLAVLILLRVKGFSARFRYLDLYLLIRMLSAAACQILINGARFGIPAVRAYTVYFYIYWLGFAAEACLGLFIVYGLYRLAMAPLPGLQRLGMLMFRWAAGIAVAVAVGMALGPHGSGQSLLIHAVTQLQQTESILVLCLLLFVTLAIRPMGLSHRSKIFGVSLGLGILACTDLVSSSWIPQGQFMMHIINLVVGITFLTTIVIWATYFALPEPKREMIVLPTTSPFLRWNQISLALGDEPGFVAIAGIPPDMLAPAEVEIMRRASVKMSSLREGKTEALMDPAVV